MIISNCDTTDDWATSAGGVLSIDNADKKEGVGSLKNTIAAPGIGTVYQTTYNPALTWDLSAKKHILLWLLSDRANTDFTYVRFVIVEGANWRAWNLTFSAGEWTAIKKLLSTGDLESDPAPDLTLIDSIKIQFQAADITAFYKKIDIVWVSRQSYDMSIPLQTEYAYIGADMYVGEARPGSSPYSSKWRIKKVFNYTTNVSRIRWANGNARFNKVWANYASYTYENL